ncbi:MAG: alanine--glyoxylate aminotransferase family protein, partial [Candidatus Omnitrophica bacterium]|nr:alanine--glyoxylate aminotransferase family protein [Candidatus Omnitrophota bacterium]
MKEPILLTPGPTPVPPEIREALARPMGHHRTPEFQAVLKEVGEGLKQVFKTAQEVLILTSSGTGAMEAAVVNLLSPGDQALVIRGGKFGERWGEICEAFGIRAVPLDTPWGRPLDLKAFSEKLSQNPGVKAVFSTLCETSTGVTYDIRGIRKAMGQSKALLAVDAISGLGSEPFAMDEWGVDGAVCGSQKGFMLPPGLAFICLSERAWQAVAQSKNPKYYFDLRLAREAWRDTDTPFTPGISLIVGLSAVLKKIIAPGVDKLIARHEIQSQAIRKAVAALGLELYTDSTCASNAVTAVKVPQGVDGKELLKRLRNQHQVILAGGQGKELAGKIFRIASMGAIGIEEIAR